MRKYMLAKIGRSRPKRNEVDRGMKQVRSTIKRGKAWQRKR